MTHRHQNPRGKRTEQTPSWQEEPTGDSLQFCSGWLECGFNSSKFNKRFSCAFFHLVVRLRAFWLTTLRPKSAANLFSFSKCYKARVICWVNKSGDCEHDYRVMLRRLIAQRWEDYFAFFCSRFELMKLLILWLKSKWCELLWLICNKPRSKLFM